MEFQVSIPDFNTPIIAWNLGLGGYPIKCVTEFGIQGWGPINSEFNYCPARLLNQSLRTVVRFHVTVGIYDRQRLTGSMNIANRAWHSHHPEEAE